MPRKIARKPRSPKANDRRLRERVFGQIASPDNSSDVTIKNMDAYIHWIKTGKQQPAGKLGPRLVAVREPVDRGQ